MMKKQTTLAVAALVAALGAGAVGVGTTLAADNVRPAPFSDLVTAIAERFDLNQDEVQAVFDEHREEIGDVFVKRHHGFHPAMRIDKAVESGELTQEQADALKAKLEEMHDDHPDFEDVTPEEMKAQVEARMAELKAWAEANGIPEDFLPMQRVFIHHGPEGADDKMFQVHLEQEATIE